MVVVPVLVACGWLFGGGEGGEGVFLGEVKARRKDIISSSLDYQKQKLSTDKQFIFNPQFTRHAGKAGGFLKWLKRTLNATRKLQPICQSICSSLRLYRLFCRNIFLAASLNGNRSDAPKKTTNLLRLYIGCFCQFITSQIEFQLN